MADAQELSMRPALKWKCLSCSGALHAENGALRCASCGTVYAYKNGQYFFLKTTVNDNRFEVRLRNFYKRFPRLYYFVATFFGPALFTGMTARRFLKKYYHDGMTVLNLGSGPKILGDSIINIDMFPYHGVTIVSDVCTVPLADGTADLILCDELVEHVESVDKLFAEVKRLLKPGGHVYFSIPFLYPFHSSPVDFSRWTLSGFKQKLSAVGLSDVEKGVLAGPFSALSAYACYVFALMFSFNSERLFWLLMNISIFIFFPIKFLDLIAHRLRLASHVASVLYYVAKK